MKTVENVERGANVYLHTPSKLVQAPCVEASALMPETAPSDPPHQEWRFKVQVMLDIPFEDFGEYEPLASFLDLLKQIVQAKYEMTVGKAALLSIHSQVDAVINAEISAETPG